MGFCNGIRIFSRFVRFRIGDERRVHLVLEYLPYFLCFCFILYIDLVLGLDWLPRRGN